MRLFSSRGSRGTSWLLAGLALIVLAGCGAPGTTGLQAPPPPKNVSQGIYEAKAALDVAIIQADKYAALPRCKSAAAVSPLCSDQTVAQKLYDLASGANTALSGAKAAWDAYQAQTPPSATALQKATAAADAANVAVQKLVGAVSLLQQKG